MKKFIEQIYRKNKNYEGIVFLDRDGTINEEVDYLNSEMQTKILPTVVRGIQILNKKRIAVVVITNQPVIARGLITIDELKKINDTLFEDLKKEGAFIDAIYSCPHHPETNHSDIPPHAMKFRIECDCRKPGLAMYKKAISDFGLKKILGAIGDQTKDVVAGKNLGIRSVIVKTGYAGQDGIHDVAPDFICNNFLSAVNALLQ